MGINYFILSYAVEGSFIFLTQKEYIADTINFRKRSFKLIVENPTNPDPRKTKLKVFTAINQNKGYHKH